MSLHLQYDSIGKDFVQQYYALFDDPARRSHLWNFYSPTDALMTFEGHTLQGLNQIIEIVQSLSNKRIIREIYSVNCHPTIDGMLINVLGRLACDQNPPHTYSQVFVLKAIAGSFFLVHDIIQTSIF